MASETPGTQREGSRALGDAALAEGGSHCLQSFSNRGEDAGITHEDRSFLAGRTQGTFDYIELAGDNKVFKVGGGRRNFKIYLPGSVERTGSKSLRLPGRGKAAELKTSHKNLILIVRREWS